MIEYFKQLNQKELIEFEKFAHSPFFTTHRHIVRLFNYLKVLHPDISSKDLTKEKLISNVFKEKNVTDVRIRKLFSEFTIFQEKFLTYLEIEKDEVRNKILLLGSLRRRGFPKRFEMNYKSVSKSFKKTFGKDEQFYINKINLANELFYFRFGELRGEFEKNLQDKSDCLDKYFIFSKLHTFNEMLSVEGTKNKDNFYKKEFYNEIISRVEKDMDDISRNHPNILIIYYALKMAETMDDKYLNKLVKYLDLNEKKFDRENLKYYYHYITQYYIKKINTGQIQYRRKVFEIYKVIDEKNLFLIDDTITHHEFNSVSNTSLALKEYSWLEFFIEEYKKHLEPKFAKDVYNLAKAKLLFQKKDYDKVFSYLNDIDLRNPNYYAHSKYLLARVYFDMNNINGVKYIVENLKQYIRNKEFIETELLNAIKIFIYYMNQLVKIGEINSSMNKSNKIIFKKELDNETKLVPNKDWFYEAVNKI